MSRVFEDFRLAHRQQNGYLLASTISPVPPKGDGGRLYDFLKSSNAFDIQTDARYEITYHSGIKLPKQEGNLWVDVFVAYYKAVRAIIAVEEASRSLRIQRATDLKAVYAAWKEVANALVRGYSSGAFASWTIPCLYVAGKYLRVFAIKADEQITSSRDAGAFNDGLQEDAVDAMSRNEWLEDAARQINRIFGLCISDRAPIEESRKWGLYYTATLLFKTYFRLNSISLSKNILRSIAASSADLPPFSAFPKSHVTPFEYYCGVIYFLEENYKTAEEHLTNALRLCPTWSAKNRSLIMAYLIPTKLMTERKLPSNSSLSGFPILQRLFTPLCAAIKTGDLAGFDAALAAGEAEFVKRRIYLTLERGRDLCLRNLMRRVFVVGGWEVEGQVRRTRVPVAEFHAAIRMTTEQSKKDEIEGDEVECLLAGLIYKNLVKGYISRERGMAVLSKSGAFPGTGV